MICLNPYHYSRMYDAEESSQQTNDEERAAKAKTQPYPREIKAHLDYVIGQARAKTMLSVAVYNHMKKLEFNEPLPVSAREKAENLPAVSLERAKKVTTKLWLKKDNILMFGPTGTGKTFLAQNVANILDVPFISVDCTTLSRTGYKGDDVQSVIWRLLREARGHVERAHKGIFFLDEVDKICTKVTETLDVGGKSVQDALLTIVNGTLVYTKDPAAEESRKKSVRSVAVNTEDILFIAAGAFTGLAKIVADRLQLESSNEEKAELKDQNDDYFFRCAKLSDFVRFGMAPEFMCRFHSLVPLHSLDENMLINVLTKPKNSLRKEYETLFSLDNLKLTFHEDGLRAIAKEAHEIGGGARGLRSIMFHATLKASFEAPGSGMTSVEITKEDVLRSTYEADSDQEEDMEQI